MALMSGWIAANALDEDSDLAGRKLPSVQPTPVAPTIHVDGLNEKEVAFPVANIVVEGETSCCAA